MKRVLLFLTLCLCAVGARAQNYTAVSSSLIQDLNGNLLPVGQICFQGTDQNSNVVSYQVGGGGPVTIAPYCAPITNGVSGPFNVPNPANTTPSNIRFHIRVMQGSRVILDAPAAYLCLDSNACGSPYTFNFDTCFSTGACGNNPLPIPSGPGGPPGPAGPTGPAGPLGTTGSPAANNIAQFSDATHVAPAGSWNFGLASGGDLDCYGSMACDILVSSGAAGSGFSGFVVPDLIGVSDGTTTCEITSGSGVTKLCNNNFSVDPSGNVVVASCSGCGVGLSTPFSQYVIGSYNVVGTGNSGSQSAGGNDNAIYSIYNSSGNQFANLGTQVGNATIAVGNNISGWGFQAQAGTDGEVVGTPSDNITRVSGYDDYAEIAAPGNPGLSKDRLYLDSTTHLVTCKTHTGTNCMPVPTPPPTPIRVMSTTWGDIAAALPLVAGSTVYFTIPNACTIISWDIAVDAGTATIDVWKIATGTAVPTISNTITASALPAISSGTAVHSTTLTGWTTSVSANDIFGLNLKVVSTAKFVEFQLQCQ